MRLFLAISLISLSSCAAAQADDPTAACADIAITEMPPIQLAAEPVVQVTMPKRVIEVANTRVMVEGVVWVDTCYVVDPYSQYVDYSGCCPAGWHALALSVGEEGLLCEED